MILKVIAYAHNGHTDKFGIPRQSRDASPIETRIVFEPEYRVPEALRGIDGYSHLWLIWGFSENNRQQDLDSTNIGQTYDKDTITWSPTVRPPRLGGNKRMGVFATRSPFRPNPLGLSSVRLLRIEDGDLIVSGADLMDGTPIYDIKPYLSFSDCHNDAKNGFAEDTKDYRLAVDWSLVGSWSWQSPTNHLLITYYSPTNHILLPEHVKKEIEYILSQDPRPGYQNDPEREYKLDYAGWTVTFVVRDAKAIIRNIEKIKK